MKIRTHTLLAVLFVLASSLSAQVSFGFHGLSGLPTVVSQGTQYDLQAWLVNTGQVPLAGPFSIKMSVNSGTEFDIDFNFQLSSALQPGDSVLWQKNNYTLPFGHFRLGNNDVLIWPTMPSLPGYAGEAVQATAYYAEGAVFRLKGKGFEEFMEGLRVEESYTLDVHAVNIYEEPNVAPLSLCVQAEGYQVVRIATITNFVQPGEFAYFSLSNFKLKDIYNINPQMGMTRVEFFVLEEGLLNPYNKFSFDVHQDVAADEFANPEGVRIFPIPARDVLFIDVPRSWMADAQVMIFDLTGKMLAQTREFGQIDLSNYPSGSYMVKIRSAKGSHSQMISVE